LFGFLNTGNFYTVTVLYLLNLAREDGKEIRKSKDSSWKLGRCTEGSCRGNEMKTGVPAN